MSRLFSRRRSSVVTLESNETIEVKLTAEELKASREKFDLIDANKDKCLDEREVKIALRRCGIVLTADKFNEYFRQVDLDGNGIIDFKEFIILMSKSKMADRQAFSLLDENNDGYIKFDELKDSLTSLGYVMTDSEVKQIMKASDVHRKDGRISYDEFSYILNAKEKTGRTVSRKK